MYTLAQGHPKAPFAFCWLKKAFNGLNRYSNEYNWYVSGARATTFINLCMFIC